MSARFQLKGWPWAWPSASSPSILGAVGTVLLLTGATPPAGAQLAGPAPAASAASGAPRTAVATVGGPNVRGKVLAVRPDAGEVDLEIDAVFEIGMPKVEVITVRMPDREVLDGLRTGMFAVVRFRPSGARFAIEWLGVLPADSVGAKNGTGAKP